MRNGVRAIGIVLGLMLAMIAPTMAQNVLASGAPPAASGPDYNVSVGYTYLTMPISSVGSANLNGVDVAGRIDLKPRFGATVDTSYVRTSNVLGTGHQGYVLSFLGGPVFYPFARGRVRTSVHALFGAGLVDGAVPVSDISFFHGWEERFSYAIGGDVERTIAGPIAARVSADFLRTAFFDPSGSIQPQNNFRLTASVVFRLRDRLHGR